MVKRKSSIDDLEGETKKVKKDDDPIINNGVVSVAIFYVAFRGTLKRYLDLWNRKGKVVSDLQKVKLAKELRKITPADVDLRNAVYSAIFLKIWTTKKVLKGKPGNCLKEQDPTFKILQQHCTTALPFRTNHGNVRKERSRPLSMKRSMREKSVARPIGFKSPPLPEENVPVSQFLPACRTL